MRRAAAAKSCGSTVSAKSKGALGRRRVGDTAITNLCAGSRSTGLPAGAVNFVNIGGVARHYW
jgi:hypothetical protein